MKHQRQICFACDCMLGRLARWLRAIGYDAQYFHEIHDAKLARLAKADGRVLLTRDTALAAGSTTGEHLLVYSNDSFEQLREVVNAFTLEVDEDLFFTRCIRCNGKLEAVTREMVRGMVPPYVYGTQENFSRCVSCGKIFWPATHTNNMSAKLRQMFSDKE